MTADRADLCRRLLEACATWQMEKDAEDGITFVDKALYKAIVAAQHQFAALSPSAADGGLVRREDATTILGDLALSEALDKAPLARGAIRQCIELLRALPSAEAGGKVEAEPMILVKAKWLAGMPRIEKDWACAECAPHSDAIVAGFKCYYHQAIDLIEAHDAALKGADHA